MNLETGVIRTSSLSIGAWARAEPVGAPSTSAIAVTSQIARFIGSSSCVVSHASAGPLDGMAPARVPFLARGRGHGRSESPLELPTAGELRRLPDPGPHAGEVGGAETSGLDHRGPKHVRVQDVGLELAQEVIGRRAAVDPERLDGEGGLIRHGVENVATLIGDRLERGPGDV